MKGMPWKKAWPEIQDSSSSWMQVICLLWLASLRSVPTSAARQPLNNNSKKSSRKRLNFKQIGLEIGNKYSERERERKRETKQVSINSHRLKRQIYLNIIMQTERLINMPITIYVFYINGIYVLFFLVQYENTRSLNIRNSSVGSVRCVFPPDKNCIGVHVCFFHVIVA
jgi:hypothetical protein